MSSLEELLKDRILVLDGAFGTMIQAFKFKEDAFRGREFISHPLPLAGFNDILTLTKPESIKNIHLQYLEAGADIISTNTFNSNFVSMKDYGLDRIEGLATRLNREGARLAKEAIKEFEAKSGRQHFVAGSIGPTNRSASMSPDISDPTVRNVSYDELFDAYRSQIEGLIDGGVDILLFETFFDTLNLKAGLAAANEVMESKGVACPIMVSATVSDNTGRILSGQTLEAFVTSIKDYDNVMIIGLNCGFGPGKMSYLIDEINKFSPCFTSCHPNAGLPDESGAYSLSAEEFRKEMEHVLEGDKINIVGGCCGTTPAFICEIKKLIRNFQPRKPRQNRSLVLSGSDVLQINDGFITIGERCNVAGSAKFLRLIKEGNLESAAIIAKDEIMKGAQVIDINMDDAMLDAKKEMVMFLRYILAEPEISKVPFMIDSSHWDVLESALKEIQGKGIVNSLSLKEGELNFIEKARKVKELGFALVVMAFDEKGQADTFERKIEICQRAYEILTVKCGFLPEDIIFDVNVMTIATGIPSDANYAADFIKAVNWIKKNLPGAKTSGGVSNLSFAFRGKNKLREYMHVVFLHHARIAGLDMAIINPSQNTDYYSLPKEIRNAIEDIIFNRDSNALDVLIDFANQEILEKNPKKVAKEENRKENSRPVLLNITEVLKQDLIKGELTEIESHIQQALKEIEDPIKIIQGPLLEGIQTVGDLFGEGKMFLPQVVKTARSMKKAVEILMPFIEKKRTENSSGKAGKILIATVKGDVHDIGKNIVATVLECNNFEVKDLGIMVAPEVIVESVKKESPDILCLSGLITPSLGEMVEVVKQLESENITVPVMVGGAATSPLHTVLKIAPEYNGIVIHMADASQNPVAASKLVNPELRGRFIEEIQKNYLSMVANFTKKIDLEPFEKVLREVESERRNVFETTKPLAPISVPIEVPILLGDIVGLINWKMWFIAWKLQGSYLETFPYYSIETETDNWLQSLKEEDLEKGKEAIKLYLKAQEIINEFLSDPKFDARALIRFEKAKGDVYAIHIEPQIINNTDTHAKKEEAHKYDSLKYPMLRQQKRGSGYLSCSDYIGENNSFIGFFAVTAGRRLWQKKQEAEEKGETLRSLLIQTLADRIVEAAAEWLQNYVTDNYWSVTIRPAWGYPMLPDQTMILQTKDLLPYHEIGISITENGAMFPPASISGLYINHPSAKYFMVGDLGNDQLEAYANERGWTIEEAKAKLRQL